ncbi:MAG: hypothetical protein ACL7BU_09220 [Candidatus Phlomobacter fragariae]
MSHRYVSRADYSGDYSVPVRHLPPEITNKTTARQAGHPPKAINEIDFLQKCIATISTCKLFPMA